MKALQKKVLVQLIVIFYLQCASYGTKVYPISEKCRNLTTAVGDVIIEAFSEIKLVVNIIHVVEALNDSVDRNEFVNDMLMKTFSDVKVSVIVETSSDIKRFKSLPRLANILIIDSTSSLNSFSEVFDRTFFDTALKLKNLHHCKISAGVT